MANDINNKRVAHVRGVTRLAWLIGKPAGSSKEPIEWDEHGNPIGKNQTRYSDCISALMRASRQFKWTEEWPNVDKAAKDNLWIRLQDVWDLEDFRKKDTLIIASNVFRSRKAHWKKENYKPYETDEERLENGPEDISHEEWVELVKHWAKPNVQEQAELNALHKSKQVIKHTSGRKSIPRRRAEMTTEENGPPSMGDLFIDTHTSKVTKDALDDVSREYIALMQHEAGVDENGVRQPITDEIYRKVMPPERNGRVRMMGPLGTKARVFGSQSSTGSYMTHIQGLKAQFDDVTAEVSNLKRKLEEKDEETERRIKDHEDAMERRIMLKFKTMFGVLSQTNDSDELNNLSNAGVSRTSSTSALHSR